MLSLIEILLSHRSITDRMISGLVVIYQLDLEYRTLAWPGQPLHIDIQSFLSHNFITESNKKISCSNISTWFAFRKDRMSNIAICPCIFLATQEQSTILCSNPIAMWYYAKEPICMDRSWRVCQASIALFILNGVPCCAGEKLCICSTVVSRNIVSNNYIMLVKSLAAFLMIWGSYQVSQSVLAVLSVEVWRQPPPVADGWLPECPNRPHCISYLWHRSSPHCLLTQATLICQTSSAAAELSPCVAVPC